MLPGVDVGVGVQVAVGVPVIVDVAVGELDGVTVGAPAWIHSYAPISQCGPCGRVMPRWSVGGQTVSLPVSMAEEPGRSGMVCVKPP